MNSEMYALTRRVFLNSMAAPTEATHKLRAYLLNEKPTEVASANKLAKRFGVEQTSAIRILRQAGYTKASDSPVWSAPSIVSDEDITLTMDKATANALVKKAKAAFQEGEFYPNQTDLGRYLGWVLGVARDKHLTINLATGITNSKGEVVKLPTTKEPKESLPAHWDDVPTDIDNESNYRTPTNADGSVDYSAT